MREGTFPMAGEPSETPQYWRFYCYRCEQWSERRGPWCTLYEAEPRTSPCVFREHPNRGNGVLWWPYTSSEDDEEHWRAAGEPTPRTAYDGYAF